MYKSYNRQPNVKLVNADPAQIYSNMSPTPMCMGGQATIHTCRHPQTGRRIAVKRICLPRSLSEKQKTRQMAINEAAALASCKCESVVRLADSNIYEAYDSVFIIMEYISGRTLYESLIRQRRPFEEPEIVKILKVRFYLAWSSLAKMKVTSYKAPANTLSLSVVLIGRS